MILKVNPLKVLISLISVIAVVGCSNNSDDKKTVKSTGPDPSVGQLGLTCKEFLNTLGPDYVFETLQVPENYNQPNGVRISVGYFRPKILNSKVAIFFNGGPGGDSHSSLQILEESLKNKNLSNRISLVYLDQRGNGCSSEYPYEDKISSTYLERLSHYGSADIVKDAEVIRQKLIGNQKWIAFGQSYGGLIVHRYVADFPESLDKALTHAGSISLNAYERNLARITSQVHVWNLFAQQYPEGYSRLIKLYKFLNSNENYCLDYKVKSKPIIQCGLDIVDELGILSYLGFNDWKLLEDYLKKIIDENGNLDTSYIKKRLALFYEETSSAYNLAMTVIGVVDRGIEAMTASRCQKMYSEISQKLNLVVNDFYTECSTSMQFNYEQNESQKLLLQYISDYKNLVTLEKLKSGIAKMSNNSFYIYSGERDIFVPKGSIEPELKYILPIVNYTHFPNSGHDGFHSEDQVLQDLVK